MKKAINLSALLISAIILSLCACKKNVQQAENNTTEPTEVETSGEDTETRNATRTATSAKGDNQKQTVYNFPNFMKFDLNDWELLWEKEHEIGDAWGTAYRYKKGSQELEFDDGESTYGYYQDFKLFDSNGKLLKERNFFHADGLISETITDYSRKPAIQYTRAQEKAVDYDLVNSPDKPLTASGEWKKSTIGAEKAPWAKKSYSIPDQFAYYKQAAKKKIVMSNLYDEYITKYFIIGWSEAGHLAYAEYQGGDALNMYLYIQDLQSDKMVVNQKLDFDMENFGTEGNEEEDPGPKTFWKDSQKRIDQKLNQYKIKPIFSQPKVRTFPAKISLSSGSDLVYDTKIEATRRKNYMGDGEEIGKDKISVIRKSDNKRKVVSTHNYDKDSFTQFSGVLGYLKNPYEDDRIAVLKVYDAHSFEGNSSYIAFIGCDLTNF